MENYINVAKRILGIELTQELIEKEDVLKRFICGYLDFESKDYLSALKHFEYSIQRNESEYLSDDTIDYYFVKTCSLFAQEYFSMKEYSKALTVCNYGLSLGFKPSDDLVNIYSIKAMTYFHDNDFGTAIINFESAIEICYTKRRLDFLYLSVADCKMFMQDFLGVYIALKKAKQLFPSNNEICEKLTSTKLILDKKGIKYSP